jgi:hypothetical protein
MHTSPEPQAVSLAQGAHRSPVMQTPLPSMCVAQTHPRLMQFPTGAQGSPPPGHTKETQRPSAWQTCPVRQLVPVQTQVVPEQTGVVPLQVLVQLPQ